MMREQNYKRPINYTAIHYLTSEPFAWWNRSVGKPVLISTTLIIFGRTRSTAPSIMAAAESYCVTAISTVSQHTAEGKRRYRSGGAVLTL